MEQLEGWSEFMDEQEAKEHSKNNNEFSFLSDMEFEKLRLEIEIMSQKIEAEAKRRGME